MLASTKALAVEPVHEPSRISRPFIERSDFSISWRGFQRDQVVGHLREVADLVEHREPPELRLTNELRETVNTLREAIASSAAEIRAAQERASAEARQALDAVEEEAKRVRTAAEEEATRIRTEAEMAARKTQANADRYAELRWREVEEFKERLMRSTQEASWFFDAAGYDFDQMRECLSRVDDGPSSAEELERRAENGWHDLAHRSQAFGDKLRSRARPGGCAAGGDSASAPPATPQVD